METTASKITRIDTLQDHVAFLSEVLKTARRRIVIVSPFVSNHAIKADNLARTIEELTKIKGVTVTVYTDAGLNTRPDGTAKPAAVDGIKTLSDMGARVIVLNGIHSKTLIRDDDLLTEGSFNWFSAVRTSGADHQREERTLVTEGGDVKLLIDKEMAKLDRLEKNEVVFADNTPGADPNYVEQKSCSSVVWLSSDAQKEHKKVTGKDNKMSKKALLVLTLALAAGGNLPAPLSGIFFIAALVALFMLILRVLDSCGEPKEAVDKEEVPIITDAQRASAGDPLARARFGMD